MNFTEKINYILENQYFGEKKKLSEGTGIPYSTVIEYLSGKKKDPKLSLLTKLKNVNAFWLLTGKGEMLKSSSKESYKSNIWPSKVEKPIMSVKERLIKFIKFNNLSVSSFEKSIEVSNGYVNNMSKSIGIDKMKSIIENYSILDIEWLLTGKGEMLKSSSKESYKSNIRPSKVEKPKKKYSVEKLPPEAGNQKFIYETFIKLVKLRKNEYNPGSKDLTECISMTEETLKKLSDLSVKYQEIYTDYQTLFEYVSKEKT